MATSKSYPESFEVHSDYLTPVEYPHHFKTGFYIEIYYIDRCGYTIATNVQTGESGYINSYKHIYTIYSDIVEGSIDRSIESDYCGSCSLEIEITEGSIFNPKFNSGNITNAHMGVYSATTYTIFKGFNWANKAIRIVKTYDWINDRNKEYTVLSPKFKEGARIINDNDRKLSELCLGWYLVDDTNTSYNDSTRRLSISGTDLISLLDKPHGSALYQNNVAGGSMETSDYSVSGYTIEAGVTPDWAVVKTLEEFSPVILPFYNAFETVNDTYTSIPYDLEFDDSETVYSVLKKIKELYSNMSMYVGTDKALYMRRLPAIWYDRAFTNEFATYIHARDLHNLVLSETTSIDFSNIMNTCTVYGRTNDVGYQPYANYSLGYIARFNEDGTFQKYDWGTDNRIIFPDIEAYGSNPFSAIQIGVRRDVVNDDNLVTEEECWNKGKHEVLKNVQFREKTNITLSDSCFPIFLTMDGLNNLGIGQRWEYTSIQTGETNCYLVNKISHNLTDGTWQVGMQTFRPMSTASIYGYDYEYSMAQNKQDQQITRPIVQMNFREEGWVDFTLSVSDVSSMQGTPSTTSARTIIMELDGLASFNTEVVEINRNGNSNTYSVDPADYVSINGRKLQNDGRHYPQVEVKKGDIVEIRGKNYTTTSGGNETTTTYITYCRHPQLSKDNIATKYVMFKIYADNKLLGETCTEDENGNKVFSYQFPKNKRYIIGVQGYSAQFPPSDYYYEYIDIDNITTAVLTDENNNVLTDEVYRPLMD